MARNKPKTIVMRKNVFLLLITVFMFSCQPKQKVDSIYWGAEFYTVDSAFSKAEAMAITDGKIVAIGGHNEIKDRYSTKNHVDLSGKFVYPGFIDAHCHFYGYGLSLRHADLEGTKSFEEVVERLKKHQEKFPSQWIQGRGWDQNDWKVKEFPTNELLDKAFPKKPVYITRIDGHAAIANTAALRLAGILNATKVEGGEIILKDAKPTGVLIDNAKDLVSKIIPAPIEEERENALLAAQANCFKVGLTSVQDVGLEKETVQLIDKLQQKEKLKMRIYAMLTPSTENFIHYLKKGIYKTDHLNVRSVKLYADGALGSRGAKLIDPYQDAQHTNGLLVTGEDRLREVYVICKKNGYQACTHAIGDSANRMVLNLYAELLDSAWDHRWRIEHAQVLHQADFMLFGNYAIVPSVQPTHATSDMTWAEDRLGSIRVKGAYAYRQLLGENKWLPLGSDFPVESINPLYGFYAATARKDLEGHPVKGWQTENALSREQALRGMTIWAAKAAFEENEKGSLEAGKWADFVIFDKDIMTEELKNIPNLKPQATYIAGEAVWQQ